MAKKQATKRTNKPKELKKEGNIYDKIFKEVVEKIFRPLIEALAIKITEEMPVHYDIETDALYLKGTQKGIEQGIEQGRSEEAAKKTIFSLRVFCSRAILMMPKLRW